MRTLASLLLVVAFAAQAQTTDFATRVTAYFEALRNAAWRLGEMARAQRNTLSTNLRALAVITSKRPLSMAAESRSDDPAATATAPARIQSPALSGVTPPVGMSLT